MSRNVVFVGDDVSLLNIDESIPFVGSRSLSTLINWISILKPTYYVCYNSASKEDIKRIKALQKWGFKVIVLGNKASERIQDVPRFTLPHPSPRNRLLNDSAYIEDLLNKAKAFIDASDKIGTGRTKWRELNGIPNRKTLKEEAKDSAKLVTIEGRRK